MVGKIQVTWEIAEGTEDFYLGEEKVKMSLITGHPGAEVYVALL